MLGQSFQFYVWINGVAHVRSQKNLLAEVRREAEQSLHMASRD